MSPDGFGPLIEEAWSALSPGFDLPATVELTGHSGHLPSRLAVEDTAIVSVAVALLAAANLKPNESSKQSKILLDRAHVAAVFRSERYFRSKSRTRGDSGAVGFAPLSRFWPAADGWVRTHANYPWHHDALLSALQTTAEPDEVGAAIRTRAARDIEDSVFERGGVAVALRSKEEWLDHEQGRAVYSEPLVSRELIGEGHPRRRTGSGLPALGVRVLDLTRVIAGPICTRYLAALGADVLRLDPSMRPDMRTGDMADTLLGKRSARLDLGTDAALRLFHELLDRADVLICGYRPGALERFGLDPFNLGQRHPGLVMTYLDAWGHSGPWAQRRGFDSVVQVATGIATAESGEGGKPGSLPCAFLDHGTGYLAAGSTLDALRRQADDGGTHVRRLSLARTAMWLMSIEGHTEPDPPLESESWVVDLDGPDGTVRAVAPPGSIDGTAFSWRQPVSGYCNDPPEWVD